MSKMNSKPFWMIARYDVGDKIKKGDHVLIDPEAPSEIGKLVLIGKNIERWNGQSSVTGVATFVGQVV